MMERPPRCGLSPAFQVAEGLVHEGAVIVQRELTTDGLGGDQRGELRRVVQRLLENLIAAVSILARNRFALGLDLGFGLGLALVAQLVGVLAGVVKHGPRTCSAPLTRSPSSWSCSRRASFVGLRHSSTAA